MKASLALRAAALALLPLAGAAWGQEGAERLTFGRRTPHVGDQVHQTVNVELALTSRERRGAEVLEEKSSNVTRRRERIVATSTVSDGRRASAYVRYLKSERRENGEGAQPDPIAGKTYYCERRGEELRVYTPEGETPPMEEFKLVAENMDTLGKPSPLAEFLAGKTLAVGEQLSLPPEVARRLLGLDEQFGEVTRFDLTLQRVLTSDGRPCGEFRAEIEAQRNDSSQMRIMVDGPMTIEARSCRAVSTKLGGPIGMSHSRPDPGGWLQVDSTGRMTLSVASRFKDAAATGGTRR